MERSTTILFAAWVGLRGLSLVLQVAVFGHVLFLVSSLVGIPFPTYMAEQSGQIGLSVLAVPTLLSLVVVFDYLIRGCNNLLAQRSVVLRED
jgi:hypothetical protein